MSSLSEYKHDVSSYTTQRPQLWRRVLIMGLASILSVALLSTWIVRLPVAFSVVSNGQHGASTAGNATADYLVGVGRADITGPVVEVNMMGFADASQLGTGLRQRLYCRAFIAGSPDQPSEKLAYLVLDTQSGDTAVRYGIIEGLKRLGVEYDVYTRHNGSALAVTGTHSHSGPGAWLNYLLPQVTSKGFEKSSYQAIVDGCVLAVKRAHQSLEPGQIKIGQSTVQNANINRSLYAYLANPQAERDQYPADVDKDITAMAFEAASGRALGVLTWFPVHGTSLYQNNTLITGDNKGVAAYLLEKAMEDSNPDFVAGFSQSNVGDTTPNVLGAYCDATGVECKFDDSTCDGKNEGCHGRGPFYQYLDQGTRSCYEIGRLQFQAALDLLRSSRMQRVPAGTVSSFHTFVDLSTFEFVSPSDPSRLLKTCSAALGYGFAGGTSDGPGAFDFQQGTNDTDEDSPSLKNPLWKVARAFIHQPSEEQIKCQSPKPILLDVGAADKPYAWTPNIVDIQIQRIGSHIMIIAPGEATTMAGRRWRNAIGKAATEQLGISRPSVVIGGPANTYAHYIATEEEYGIQRYEGASTLYGPHTLAAYINLTSTYLPYLGTVEEVAALPPLSLGPQPPINIDKSLTFIEPVVLDSAGILKKYGDEIEPAAQAISYRIGDKATGRFVGANPRNNFRLEGTFASVERFSPQLNTWTQVRSDRDWYLVYNWKRTSTVLGTSEVTIEWTIEDDTPSGQYRIKYYGDAKSLGGTLTPFEGTGKPFTVIGSSTNSGENVASVAQGNRHAGDLLT